MAFEKGIKKPPKSGRTKGVKNKKTAILDAFAKSVCEGGAEKFKRELNKLQGEKFINAYMQLFEYVKPKLSRTTHAGDADNPVVFSVGYGEEE